MSLIIESIEKVMNNLLFNYGKTTIAKMLHKQCIEEGYNITFSREPGGVDIAEQIRDVITDVNNTKMDARTEALLYAASRRQHLVE